MGVPTRTRLSILSISTSIAVVAAVLATGAPALASPALAPDTALAPAAAVAASTPSTVSSDPLPTAQINGVVWDQEVIGNTVYVGGNFSTAQPAGSAAGANTVKRGNLMAYNLQSGDLLSSFAPQANAEVVALAASPDGSRIYVGGTFTAISGVTRYRLAAFDTATGELIPSFAPVFNAKVQALAVTDTTIYVGGIFTSANNVARSGAAALSTSTGALLPWSPKPAGGSIQAMVVSPDQSKVVLGGNFTSLNRSTNPGYGLGAVDIKDGDLLPWNVNSLIRNGGSKAAILSLSSDATSVYGSGYVYGNGGNLEGAFRASWDNGDVVWVEDCHGDTYSVAPINDVVYMAGHAHYCGTVGGFPQTNPWGFHRAVAFTTAATGTLTRNLYSGYYNFEGNPSPSLLNWFPDFNTGTFTGQSQGPWSVVGNDQYVVYGGEFTTVNNKRQQGLVRFATKDNAPNKDGPRLGGKDLVPTATSFAAGTARLSWTANWDRDDKTLTYSLIRDGNNAAPVYTISADSTFWDRPVLGHVDTGLTPGQAYTYRVRTTDAAGNTAWGGNVSVTVSKSGTVSAYSSDVLDDNPLSYWPLDETSGRAYDWASGNDQTAARGVTRGVTGAIVGEKNTAYAFNGSSSGYATAKSGRPGPDSFSVEAWINTTTKRGGKIIGFGNSTNANSASYDRHVYMDNSGRLWFGVYPGSVQTVNSTAAYNDGTWHHVVASLGSGGMQLFVDGTRIAGRSDVTSAQAYSGVWHIGGDSLGSWTSAPSSNFFAGSIDEVAVYSAPLSDAQVARHYARGTGAVVEPPIVDPPVVDPPAGTDPGPSVTAASDAFARTVTGGWGSADTGGAWTTTGSASNYSVGSGTAKLVSPSAGSTMDVSLTQVSASDTEVTVTTSLKQEVTGSGIYTTVIGRQVGTDYYGARLRFLEGGQVNLQAMHKTSALDAIALPGLHYAPGDQLHVRVQVSGTSPTTIRAKAWKVGSTEPAAWQVTATDSTAALQKAGNIGLSVYVGGSVTNAPTTTEFDNLTVGPITDAEPGGAGDGGDAGTPTAIDLTAAASGATISAYPQSILTSTMEVRATLALAQKPTGSGIYLSAIGRKVGTADYRARVRFFEDGSVNLQLMNSNTTLTAVQVGGLKYTVGEKLTMRVQVLGTSPTTIRAKVWPQGTPEPSDWQLSTTDSSASLQKAGTFGVSVYLGGSATNAPSTAIFSDLSAREID